jgi:hypothetical protein
LLLLSIFSKILKNTGTGIFCIWAFCSVDNLDFSGFHWELDNQKNILQYQVITFLLVQLKSNAYLVAVLKPAGIHMEPFSLQNNMNFVLLSGIVYVVDTGVAKEKTFDPIKNVSSLRIQAISQSSAQQRAGRAGRTQPGVCYRLYSEDAFLRMRPSSVPEIKRLQMGHTVLKLLSLGISRPEHFDYIESPGEENIRVALGQLSELGAVSIDWAGQV